METTQKRRGRPRQYESPTEKVREWRKRKRDDGDIETRSLEVSFRIGHMEDHRIEELAAHWQVGKSEALRRLIALAFTLPEVERDLEALSMKKLHGTK